MRLNGQPYTVVGVVPGAVQFSRPAEIWTLTPQFPDEPRLRAGRAFEVVARLKPGVTMEAAQVELGVIADRLAREYPDANKGAGVVVEPIRGGIVGRDLQTTSAFLLGVVGFVLLLCCANVANLLLARATARAREIAVRSALGAERGRIIRQLLTESLVLAALGGTLGIGVGAAILRAAPALIPPGLLPAAITPAFDVRVVMFGLAAALAVGVVFGLIPAWQATGASLAAVMRTESRSATSTGRPDSQRSRGGRGRAGGRAAVRRRAAAANAGEARRRRHRISGAGRSVLTLDFSLRTGANSRYPTDEAVVQFYDAVARDVSALPEVRHVGFSSSLPYGTSELGRWAFAIAGDPPSQLRDRPTADYTTTDPGYFTTLDLPIVSGRGFNERDTLRSVPVCLVNEALVRRHFKNRNPIGARLSLTRSLDRTSQVREIVGVARQTSGEPDAPEELLQVYAPLAQFPIGDVYMVVQPSAGSAEALTPLMRRVVARIDPDMPVRRDRTLEVLSVESTAGYRFRAKMVGTFAVLALRPGDGGGVRRARLYGAAATARDRRAHGPRRDERPRHVAGVPRRRLDDRERRRPRHVPGGRLGPADRDVPLWCRSARPSDVRQRARRDPAHGDRRRRRTRLARQPHQPGRRVSSRRLSRFTAACPAMHTASATIAVTVNPRSLPLGVNRPATPGDRRRRRRPPTADPAASCGCDRGQLVLGEQLAHSPEHQLALVRAGELHPAKPDARTTAGIVGEHDLVRWQRHPQAVREHHERARRSVAENPKPRDPVALAEDARGRREVDEQRNGGSGGRQHWYRISLS